MLYIVSTPIGNLDDITLRAIDVLRNVDIIAAEDTRRSRILLDRHRIKKRLISYNDYNKAKRIPVLIGLLKQKMDIALVSDAGTPGLSDPGYALIREAIKNNIDISPIPGPNAAVSALVCSGLPTDRFSFYGFLPKKGKKKIDFLSMLKKEDRTAVVYESPHRIKKTLELMKEMIPDKSICLARELTKRYEEFIRGSPAEIIDRLGNRTLRGEIVLVIR